MAAPYNLTEALITAWRTNNRVTVFLFENLPSPLWSRTIPGAPNRTIRMIAGHLHNARCMWIKMLGRPYAVPVPRSVDRYRVTRAQLIAALSRSSHGIVKLLERGVEHGGRLPTIPWLNFSPDVMTFLAYFLAHEGHHRGQIVLLARQLGHRLPNPVTIGLWQWSKRAAEALH